MDENNIPSGMTDEQLQQYYEQIKQQHEENNAWSAEQAQKAMDYQTEMSNTAHQREVADLKAAGLNPVLSAGGQGATTGSGIQAQRADTNTEALYGLISKAFQANIEQAKAMAYSAKYSSGASGVSNVESLDSDGNSTLGTIYNSLKEGVAGFLQKRFGIPKDATEALFGIGEGAYDKVKPYAKATLSDIKSEWSKNPNLALALGSSYDSSSIGSAIKANSAFSKAANDLGSAFGNSSKNASSKVIHKNNSNRPWKKK